MYRSTMRALRVPCPWGHGKLMEAWFAQIQSSELRFNI